ncbi:hypothetical protein JQ626_27780 [Bradyrhizobium diazoefficiens]|nr:hypothetical protein [Bradyrhizobium diazoefficiens]MBR0967870.1 hypothetical protein [Bradyrhizobium diazoefficiens]MBR0981264.1 hypothetical protein [Bradyrhizobium diazoefficiens]MBR1010721.1 hypothetical protein [Bradyrhizobium diazoefficiens]MBR1015728.1 hypothetical protein [Bradyrhizobium diazoefficiens]MBR1060940.1 hypothetical protein [Bradyrhizobium diazoefficiens]
MVDLEARSVEVEADKWPGYRWSYRNGNIGPTMTGGPGWVLKLDIPARVPVVQFMNVTPQWITIGARDVDGDLVKVSTFNRSALGKHGAACRWHSSEEFGVG